MSDFQTERSRVSARGRKRKQNRLMNLLIGIVCILIVIVAASLFFGGGSEKTDQPAQTAESGSESGNNGGDNGSGAGVSGDSDKNQQNNGQTDSGGTKEEATSDQNGAGTADESTSNQNGTDTTNGTNESTADDQKSGDEEKQPADDSKKQGEETEGVPQGPWEPIGTSQEPPHVSSYERGTVDWNEKVEALLYATGLTGLGEDDFILWRMENGGGPQQSIGKLSTNAKPHEWYIVHLRWIKNKGWKPTSVEKVHKETLPE